MSKKRQNQTPVLIVYVISMLISMVIFGFAAVFLLDRFVTQPKLERQKKQAAEENSFIDDSPQETDHSLARRTFLFVGADGQNINGMALVRVLPDLLSVKIVPVSPMTISSAGDTEGTMAHLYETGGIDYLKKGVEKAFGISCERYIKITNDGWAGFVDQLGGTSSYSFPQDLYYKNEATGEITSFSKGTVTRTLYGDDIRRIITYPLYQNSNETRVQVVGELSVSLINSACTYNSGSVTKNLQAIFNVLYNNSDTDINSKGFKAVRDSYEYLIENSTAPATYRLPAGMWDDRGYFILNDEFKAEISTYFELSED